MCLLSFTKDPIIADGDIVCYKLLYTVNNNENLIYVCPYTTYRVFKEYKKNFKLAAQKNTAINPTVVDYIGLYLNNPDITRCVYKISENFIHTYRKKRMMSYAKNVTRWFSFNGRKLFIRNFYKCIITKGCAYYIGQDGDYASDYIIFKGKYRFNIFDKPVFF